MPLPLSPKSQCPTSSLQTSLRLLSTLPPPTTCSQHVTERADGVGLFEEVAFDEGANAAHHRLFSDVPHARRSLSAARAPPTAPTMKTGDELRVADSDRVHAVVGTRDGQEPAVLERGAQAV